MDTRELAPEAVDCHVHAGLERAQSLARMLGYCRDDGREVVGLLDHAELYMTRPPGWGEGVLDFVARRIASTDELADLVDLYRDHAAGPEAFYHSAREGIRLHGAGLRVAVGIEVNGASLESGLIPDAWLDGADFLGICTTQPPADGAWGEHLAKLLSLADHLRGGREMGLVLHHPFRWRLFDIARASSGAMPEAGGFSADDARVTANALADAGAVAEVNFASLFPDYVQHQVGGPDKAREVVSAARAAFARLCEAGGAHAVKFSLGSDMHALPKGLGVYRPSEMLETLGLGMGDVELPCEIESA